MNFMKRKPPQPITDLQSLFKKATDLSVDNYNAEKSKEVKKAFQGWKSLHTTILFELDRLNKDYNLQSLTQEENFILTEVKYLDDRAKENMNRLEVTIMKEISDLNKSFQSNSIDSSNSTSSAPPQARRMLKTLRTPRLNNNNSSSSKFHSARFQNNSSTSSISQSAASTIWKGEEKSLKSKKDEDIDVFKEFSSVNDPSDVIKSKKSSKNSPKNSISTATVRPKQLSSPVSETISKFNKLGETTPSLFNPPPISTKKVSPSTSQSTEKINEQKKTTESIPTSRKSAELRRPKSSARKSTKPALITPIPRLSPSEIALKASKISAKASSNTSKHKKPQSLNVKKPVVKKVHSAPNTRSVSPQRKLKNGASTKPNVTKSRSIDSKSNKFSSEDENSNEDEKDTETISSYNNSKSDIDDNIIPAIEINEHDVEQAMQDQIISEIKGIDKDAAKQIFNEIVDQGDEVHWEDIAGLVAAKNSLKEAVVYPFLRPDLFSGLREPARGMLLFGPPGTGKTMLAKAVATESKSTYFSISASSLTSKYLGESEKLVRALFSLAKKLSPSIIFIDEIDSLLSARTDNENESTRRIKTEFLIQWNDLSHAAVGHNKDDPNKPRVLVLAATNLPWNIDEAARRRFVRRQYIPLPEYETRKAQFVKMLSLHQQSGSRITDEELEELVKITDGFSGSDITALTKDAAMNPLRELGDKVLDTPKEEIRGLTLEDFKVSLQYIRPSVSKEGLTKFDEWASKYGSSGA